MACVCISLSLSLRVSEKYHEAFVGNIPLESLKELPPAYMYDMHAHLFTDSLLTYLLIYSLDHLLAFTLNLITYVYVCRTWMGYFAYIVWFGSLIFFLYQGYTAATTQEYMSLDESSGSCDTVSKEMSNTFLADQFGVWENNPSFQSSHATYELNLKSLSVTKSEYDHMMDNIKASIDEVSAGAPGRDLFQNILFWTTWEYPIPDTVSVFHFTADISTVFSKRYHYAAIASSVGACPLKPSTSYDINSATFTLSFDYANYINASCDKSADPQLMGYWQLADDQFVLSIDMRSFMIIAAVRSDGSFVIMIILRLS